MFNENFNILNTDIIIQKHKKLLNVKLFYINKINEIQKNPHWLLKMFCSQKFELIICLLYPFEYFSKDNSIGFPNGSK